MTPTAVVYESPISGERFEIDVPLESRRNVDELRSDLGLPDYLDIGDSQVARAVGVLWAAKHAPGLAHEHASLAKLSSPVRLAVFGGVAIRMLCRSANEDGPFRRPLGDVDLVTTRSEGQHAVALLTGLGDALGSRFWHATTKSDEMFNALRRGRRYRLHAAEEDRDGSVRGCVVDLLADEISFCHTIRVIDALERSAPGGPTVGATEVLLTKLQAIRAVDPAEIDEQHRYRVIGELRSTVLIGPEDKDLLDVAALLHDRGIGPEPDQVDPDRLGAALRRDWGLARTLRLNVANVAMFRSALEKRAAPAEVIALVERRLAELLSVIDDPRFQPRKPRLHFGSTWWEVVEDHEHD